MLVKGAPGLIHHNSPDDKVHGVNMGPIWGRQHPGGPNVGPMNFAIWVLQLMVLHFYMLGVYHEYVFSICVQIGV